MIIAYEFTWKMMPTNIHVYELNHSKLKMYFDLHK